MNYHNITKADMLNGEGVRVVLWVAGCSHHCPKCQNPETWDYNGGIPFDDSAIQEIFNELEKDWCDGLTLSGGDPLHVKNRETIFKLCSTVKERFPNKTIWCYTGYRYEELLRHPQQAHLLRYIDVLVDGPFVQALRDESLLFRGSSNQRLIDVQASLQAGEVVLFCYDPYL